ncbi:TonB-dependent receptor plug domain-containing protein [Arcobacter sp.]|uniref:TonB-dependent receptor plug domain-containing protein n=1 Tax=Arcobacter sp. TaxID=1872629 RepID=UPI003C7204E9
MNKSIKDLVLSISMCTSTLLLANDNATFLEEITVLEQGNALKLRSEVNSNKIIIDKEKILKYNDATAGDVLKRFPSVTFDGEPTSSETIKLRGLDAKYTQVLINGQRVPGAGENREFQIDLIPADMIEKIEIYKTPTANFDSQGVAGTINIILKQNPNTRLFTFKLGMSKLENESGTPNASFTYGDKIDKLSYIINLNAKKRDVTNDKIKEKFDADGTLSSKDQEEEIRKFDEIFFSTNLNLELDERNTLSFNPNYTRSKDKKTKVKDKFKDSLLDSVETENKTTTRKNYGFDTQWNHTLNDETELSLMLMLQENKDNKVKHKAAFENDGTPKEKEIEKENTTDKERSVKLSGASEVAQTHIFDYGIEYIKKQRDKSKSNFEIDGTKITDQSEAQNTYSQEENRLNVFLQDEFTINEKNIFTTGIRYEWTQFTADDVFGAEHTNTDYIWNPSINYLYHISKNDKLKIGLAQTVSRPNFEDLNPYTETDDGTRDKPDKIGNPDLNPEIAHGIDISLEHYLDDKKGLLSANVFYRDIKDKMQTNIILNTQNNRYEEKVLNQGQATVKGLELEANYDLSDFISNLKISSNITFMKGNIKDKTSGEDVPVADMPDYTYNIGFEHSFLSTYKWGMNYNYVSSTNNLTIAGNQKTKVKIEAEKRLDLFIKAKLNKNYSLNFAANNLLKVKKASSEREYKNGLLQEIQNEVETSQRVFKLSLVGKF